MTDDIFGDNATQTNGEPKDDPSNQSSGQDTDPNLMQDDPLAELVGEGKKYKTAADLAKAVREKDAFIERLKEENGGMRDDLGQLTEKLQKATTLDDVLSKITASRDSGGNQSLGDDEVRKLVNAALNERETVATQQANLQKSQQMVLEHLSGDMDKARAFVSEKAEALGMSKEDLMQVAIKSPNGFAQLVGVTAKSGGVNTPSARSSEQVSNGVQNEPATGTKAYYDRLRRENPALYWNQKTQQQMLKDAERDMDKFMGRR